jgi:hypothetical protein
LRRSGRQFAAFELKAAVPEQDGYLHLLLHFLGFFLHFLAAFFDVLACTLDGIARSAKPRQSAEKQNMIFLTWFPQFVVGCSIHLLEQSHAMLTIRNVI